MTTILDNLRFSTPPTPGHDRFIIQQQVEFNVQSNQLCDFDGAFRP